MFNFRRRKKRNNKIQHNYTMNFDYRIGLKEERNWMKIEEAEAEQAEIEQKDVLLPTSLPVAYGCGCAHFLKFPFNSIENSQFA